MVKQKDERFYTWAFPQTYWPSMALDCFNRPIGLTTPAPDRRPMQRGCGSFVPVPANECVLSSDTREMTSKEALSSQKLARAIMDNRMPRMFATLAKMHIAARILTCSGLRGGSLS